MDSVKLKEIRSNLAVLPVLIERAEKLRRRIHEAEEDVKTLGRKLEEESLDVENLKKESFSTTLLKLMGKYEGKLDKESQEMLAAKMEYDKSVFRVKELNREQGELLSRISVLRSEQQNYETELRRREQIMMGSMNDAVSIQYKQLEEERQRLERQLIEMDEALRAAYRVKDTAQSAMKHLDSAEDWATYDVWFKGGLFTHMAKYDHIDNAEEDFNKLHSQMKDLKKELSDIDILDIPETSGIDSTTRAIDFWFDNIFTDLSVRNQIREDMEQIGRIYEKIDSVISHIESKKDEVHKTLENIERERNELIISL